MINSMRKSKTIKLQLPKEIKVKTIKTKEGNYIAELPEYDAFTQAKSREELSFLINDLIFTLFDVPKAAQSGIWYKPKKESSITKVENVPLIYQILASQRFDRLLHV